MYESYMRLPIKVKIIPYTWGVEPASSKKSVMKVVQNNLKFLLRYLRFTLKILFFLKSEKPDIVISNTVSIPWAAYACSVLAIEHVWIVREDFRQEGTVESLNKTIFNKDSLFNLSSRVLMPSKELVKKWNLSNDQRSKVTIIYSNPFPDVNIDFRKNLIPEIKSAIWVGTYNHNKNPFFILREIKINRHKLRNWYFNFFGEGPLYEDLRKFVEKNHLSSIVSINMHQQNLEKFFLNSQIAISTSLNEAFGRILAEASKFGVVPVYPCGTSWEERFMPGKDSLCFNLAGKDDLTSMLNKLEDENFYMYLRNNLYANIQHNYTLELPEITLARVLRVG